MATKKVPFNFEEFVAKLEGPRKILFMAAVIMIAIALMDRLMIGPFMSQMEYLQAEGKAKIENVKRSRRIISFRDRILEEYSKYSIYLDTGATTEEEIIGALLKKIETIAAQQSVTITNIRPGDVERKPIYHVYKTNIECEGVLANMLAFINLLEQSDYLFQVEKYMMGPKSRGSDIIKCSLDITRILISAEKIDELKNSEEFKA